MILLPYSMWAGVKGSTSVTSDVTYVSGRSLRNASTSVITAKYILMTVFDPVHTMPAESENGTQFLRLGVAFTRDRHEKM